MVKKIMITQIRSAINRPKAQGATLEALGIRGINHTVEHKETPQIRGMIESIKHLLRVTEKES